MKGQTPVAMFFQKGFLYDLLIIFVPAVHSKNHTPQIESALAVIEVELIDL